MNCFCHLCSLVLPDKMFSSSNTRSSTGFLISNPSNSTLVKLADNELSVESCELLVNRLGVTPLLGRSLSKLITTGEVKGIASSLTNSKEQPKESVCGFPLDSETNPSERL